MNTTFPTKSILDDVAPTTLDAAAILCGMESATPAFRTWARNTPAFSGAFTVGDVSRAYLKFALAELGGA